MYKTDQPFKEMGNPVPSWCTRELKLHVNFLHGIFCFYGQFVCCSTRGSPCERSQFAQKRLQQPMNCALRIVRWNAMREYFMCWGIHIGRRWKRWYFFQYFWKAFAATNRKPREQVQKLWTPISHVYYDRDGAFESLSDLLNINSSSAVIVRTAKCQCFYQRVTDE